MSRPTIIINELDAERIDRLLEKAEFASLPVADALNEELDRAQMCTPETMPHDVVTMNSQVKFRNLTTGEELTRTLVYPAQMTDSSTAFCSCACGCRTAGPAHGRYHPLGIAGRRLCPS
jgi:regulator of nucleoside diphosphate kinase